MKLYKSLLLFTSVMSCEIFGATSILEVQQILPLTSRSASPLEDTSSVGGSLNETPLTTPRDQSALKDVPCTPRAQALQAPTHVPTPYRATTAIEKRNTDLLAVALLQCVLVEPNAAGEETGYMSHHIRAELRKTLLEYYEQEIALKLKLGDLLIRRTIEERKLELSSRRDNTDSKGIHWEELLGIDSASETQNKIDTFNSNIKSVESQLEILGSKIQNEEKKILRDNSMNCSSSDIQDFLMQEQKEKEKKLRCKLTQHNNILSLRSLEKNGRRMILQQFKYEQGKMQSEFRTTLEEMARKEQ